MKKNIIIYQQDKYNFSTDNNDTNFQKVFPYLKDANTLILPEQFCLNKKVTSLKNLIQESNKGLEFLLSLSERFPHLLIIGGSVIRKKGIRFYNSCPVVFNQSLLGWYDKRKLHGIERLILQKGNGHLIIDHPRTKKKFGIMICADVFVDSIFESYKGVDYIVVVTASPYLKNDNLDKKKERDKKIFQDKIKGTSTKILKVCCVRNSPQKIYKFIPLGKLQGRSFICDTKDIKMLSDDIWWSGVGIYNESENKLITKDI